MLNKKSMWYQDAVFYQIYPQSFYDSNSDGIGDLKGICQKLDYLKELGVDGIWLNPIYPSPFKDAGYDVIDHKAIAPRYGTMKDFDGLVKECHNRNIAIIMDFLPLGTSDQHPWFKESSRKEKNRYSKWYIWCEAKKMAGTSHFLNYGGLWVKGHNGRWDGYHCTYFPSFPDLNYGNQDLNPMYGNSPSDPDIQAMKAEMKKTLRFWLDRDVDGFRCDSAELLVKRHGKEVNQPETGIFWREVRKLLNKYPNKVMIAEAWRDPFTVINEWGFDLAFHFGCLKIACYRYEDRYLRTDAQGDPLSFDRALRNTSKVQYNDRAFAITLSNHDVLRPSVSCDGNDDLIKLAFLLLLTQKAVPFIYYGDEIGMNCNMELPSKEGAMYRISSRTPMQWDGSNNAGFSTAHKRLLYLPINKDYKRCNVEEQAKNPESILSSVKKIIQIRKKHPALRMLGDKVTLYAKKGDPVYAYLRLYKKDRIFIIMNASRVTQIVKIDFTKSPLGKGDYRFSTLISKDGNKWDDIKLSGKNNSCFRMKLSPFDYYVIQLKRV